MSSNSTRNQYQIKLFHFNEIMVLSDQLNAPQSSTRTITYRTASISINLSES
ncbi:hypothetical protein MHH57_17810 [Paenibacillus sp. FSL H7-0442]|uniref:hypothetical protein n=1 Tax=Paenibacillus sp. FSL H7-0442 TaxID=2921435 RepID=UPI003158654D